MRCLILPDKWMDNRIGAISFAASVWSVGLFLFCDELLLLSYNSFGYENYVFG